jgi:histone H3/H4
MESDKTDPGKEEILVVASKLKTYIRDQSGMNTSSTVMEALSSRVRQLCDQAIDSAKREGRKTVMDRDFG